MNLNSLLFFIIICCFSVSNVYAQCDVKFTDDGGLDNPYEASTDTTYTFCPDVAGDVVTVTFTFVDIETTTGTGSQGGCWDFLSIYSGSDTSAPLQETACGELDGDGGTPSVAESLLQAGDSFTSNSADGCITITFSSDGSVQGQGWVADVSCGPPPQCAAPVGLSASNVTDSAADLAWSSIETSFNIEWGPIGFAPGSGTVVSGVGNPYSLSGLDAATSYDFYVCAVCDDGAGGTIISDCTGPQTFTTEVAPPECGTVFYDTGGPDGQYDNSADESYTICPDVAGDVVTLTFTFVDIETGGSNGGCYDFLSIYNGSDTSTPLQAFACGELDGDGSTPSEPTSLLQAGDFFTSTAADGCLTVTFSSDTSVPQDGWAANITCAPPADCPQPAGLMASNIGGSSAELSWTSDETTFNIEFDTTGFTPGMGMMVNGVSNPYTLTGLMPETEYDYYICAVCDDGAGGTIVSNCTGPLSFTTDVACPAPTDLTADNVTETSADLSWTSTESAFDIEWGPSGFAPGEGTTVNGVTNPYTLSGLSDGTAYDYYVCAVCDDGMGGTISSECTGPSTFATAVPAPTCSSGLFFDNGGPAAAYAANSLDSLTICPDVAGDVVTLTFTFVDIETTTGTGVQDGCWDFLSIYNGSGTADTLQMTACGELDGDGGTPSVPESLLQAGDFFTSTAADGCLTITFDSDGSAQEEGWEATITCAPPSDCPQPSGLATSNIGGNSAELSWTSDESTFDIEWGPTGFTPGSGTVESGVGNPYTLTGLMPETTYDYYVCAVCDDGMGGTITSNCTGPISFTTDVACPAPTDLTADNITETSADLSWTSTETTFNIEYDTTGFTPGMGMMVNGVSNPYTLTGLDAATAYEYYVCAVCDDGMGGTIASECTGPFTFATAVPAPTCSSGTFFDNGGATAYAASSSDSIVICPDMMGDVVTVTFTFVDIETGGTADGDCYDFLSIYNGSGTLDTLQAFACGELDGDGSTPSVPESLLQAGDSFTSTAADGCLTFTFSSDTSVQEEGWEATVTCAPSTTDVPGCTDPCATNYDPAATVDDGSCTLPEEPATACYETATFNTATCMWDVTGEQPVEPATACYETATFNDATCVWDVTGEQPVEPATACYETATFNDATCVWDVTGEQPAEPTTACYETATFNDATCVWDVTGEQPAEPTTACYETATFNDATCVWDVTGEHPTEPTTACYETATFNDATCVWDVTGEQPAEPTTACYETATFNDATCVWDVTGEQPVEPATACYETATFNDATCVWDVTGEQPAEPATDCYETAIFNNATCVWDVMGDPPAEPATECYETATFNGDPAVCAWEVTGEQPPIDDGCEFTDDSFDDINCVAVNVSNCPAGTSLDEVNCECTTDILMGCTDPCASNYDPAANQDDGSCILPTEPTTECYETATFNNATCQWEVTGEQPTEPTTECYQTATFNDMTCAWDVSGDQPAPPATACYETATFNGATCVWDVTGEQPTIDDGCEFTDDSFDDVNCVAVNTPNCPDGTTFDAANCACVTYPVPGCTDPCATNYDPNATLDDGSCMLPAEPSTACYETATFNTATCQWDVTGEQPTEPTIECFETAIFDDATCTWEVTGSQPPEPVVECYETATFSSDICDWEITGEPPVIDDGCDVTDDSFDDVNCVAVNTPNCPAGTMFNAANCECVADPIPGCTDATACNYDANANADDGSCVYATGCDTCAADGTVIDNPEAGDACNDGDDMTENDTIQADCTCAGTPIGVPGCMDANACNYDAAATIDDGSCILPGDACNDGNPLTINDTVQADCSCAGIDSGEPIPTVGEWGLIILALILLNLGVLYIRQTEMRIISE